MIKSMNICIVQSNPIQTDELLSICYTLQKTDYILDFRQYGNGVQIKFDEQHFNHIKSSITNLLESKPIFN